MDLLQSFKVKNNAYQHLEDSRSWHDTTELLGQNQPSTSKEKEIVNIPQPPEKAQSTYSSQCNTPKRSKSIIRHNVQSKCTSTTIQLGLVRRKEENPAENLCPSSTTEYKKKRNSVKKVTFDNYMSVFTFKPRSPILKKHPFRNLTNAPPVRESTGTTSFNGALSRTKSLPIPQSGTKGISVKRGKIQPTTVPMSEKISESRKRNICMLRASSSRMRKSSGNFQEYLVSPTKVEKENSALAKFRKKSPGNSQWGCNPAFKTYAKFNVAKSSNAGRKSFP